MTPGIARAQRAAIESTIEHLIAALDILDGDADLEDDDPAGDICDLGEPPDWCGEAQLRYGADQAAGPINVEAEYEAYLQRRNARIEGGGRS